MKIKTDRQGSEAIQQLCDLALKTTGLANLKAINDILASIEIIEEDSNDE